MKRKLCKMSMVVCVILFVCSCERTSLTANPDSLSLNGRLTNQAWVAFNNGDHEHAFVYADQCINEFSGDAERNQLQFLKSNTPLPPTGIVNEQEKKKILDNGLLNDVATCLYIKGKSAEALGRKEEAVKAYQRATKLTYARCWDPQGWFWSPSDKSQSCLILLK